MVFAGGTGKMKGVSRGNPIHAGSWWIRPVWTWNWICERRWISSHVLHCLCLSQSSTYNPLGALAQNSLIHFGKRAVFNCPGPIIYVTCVRKHRSQKCKDVHLKNRESHRQSFFPKLLTGLFWRACPIYWIGAQLSAASTGVLRHTTQQRTACDSWACCMQTAGSVPR